MIDPLGLSTEEHQAIALLAEFYNLMVTSVVAKGPTTEPDLAELAAHVHTLQHMVMGQAAARCYPDTYRLLGAVIPGS